MQGFYVTIASIPDREHLVAEIFYQGVQWAEISRESEETRIQFYSHPEQEHWDLPCEEALEALKLAKNKLAGTE